MAVMNLARPVAPLTLALLAAMPLVASAGEGWPRLADGTRSVIFVTGEDMGFVQPPGCDGRLGGALYREPFDRWLAVERADVERIWVAAGNGSAYEDLGSTVSLDELLALYERVGYRAFAPGLRDVGPLLTLGRGGESARQTLPLLAANLREFETGEPLFGESAVVETDAGRVAFVGVLPHRPDSLWGQPPQGTVLTEDDASSVREAVGALRDEADLVVLLASHSYTELHELLGRIEGVDVVVSARSGAARATPEEVRGVPVLWIGWRGHYLGRLALGGGGEILSIDAVRVEGDFPVDPLTGELKAAASDPGPLSVDAR
ncbi:MAG: hypothetical protein OEQ13_08685 [Acidobacteriota bacterium]|nr:hypothetical protein [Acidobacteriota bacterium]